MKKTFSIVKRAYFWLFLWIGAVITSWVVFFSTAQFSEEFTGGVKVVFNGKVDASELSEGLSTYLEEQGFPKLKVHIEQPQGQVAIKINARLENNELVAKLSQEIPTYLQQEQYIVSEEQIIDQTVIWPSVGQYMQTTAMQALWFGIIAMVIYMIFSFGEIRKYISPAILAVVVVLSTIVSMSIPAGAYGIWMAINTTVQVDVVFIIAILTIIGYGINDVIIIFDRVRENMIKYADKKEINMLQIFEESIWQTMKRSIGTGVSTLLVLIAMFIFGTGVIATFAFTVGIGVIVSTLSSIFIGVPTAYLMLQLIQKKK